MSGISSVKNMFADSVMTKSVYKGYMVHIVTSDYQTKEKGPYSKSTAILVLNEFLETPRSVSGYLLNLETGEIENELVREVKE